MIDDEFEVRWFRENTTGAVEDLGLGNPNIPMGMDWLSRYHNTKLFNQAYSPSLLGKYWCQVINTTADPDQPLMRSNMFTLLAPGDYSGPTCTQTTALQFVDNQYLVRIMPLVDLDNQSMYIRVAQSQILHCSSCILSEPSDFKLIIYHSASPHKTLQEYYYCITANLIWIASTQCSRWRLPSVLEAAA